MPIADLRFLVAENHDFQRLVLVKALQSLGAKTIHEAADGQAALDILRDPLRSVDIVISDLDMPGMDGMEFLRLAVSAKDDLSQVTRATHRMIGASRMIGAREFANACERIDHASRAGDWTTGTAAIPAFEQELLRLDAVVDSM